MRLLNTPQPYSDETFGSWFRRLAACQHASREELAAALLEVSLASLQAHRIDWDAQPPSGLIERLIHCAAIDRDTLEALLLPPSDSLLPVHERNLYCPNCWQEDLPALTVHERRSWLECWAFRCPKHDCVLRSFKSTPEPALRYAATLAANRANAARSWANGGDANRSALYGMFMEYIPKEYLRPFKHSCVWRNAKPSPYPAARNCAHCGPHHIAEWIAGRKSTCYKLIWTHPSTIEAGRSALSDLVVLVGSATKLDEPTLLESWQGRGAWLDDLGNRGVWPRVKPQGPLEIRIGAVNLAFCIWSMMADIKFARIAGACDRGYGLANLMMRAHTLSMLTYIHRMLAKWPDIYVKQWFEAYQEVMKNCDHLRV